MDDTRTSRMNEAAALVSEGVYDRLRADIVHGRLRPNERLVESELAELVQASRTPVRETLQRLQLDGLVTRRRGGWVVREHSSDEIRAIYEVRAALEGYAAFLAAERSTTDEVAGLGSLYPLGETALALPPDAQVELNERFHNAVIAAARNPRLARLCRDSRQYYFNYRIARLYSADDTRRSIEGHRKIVAALEERDAHAAEARARKHVGEALEIVLDKLG
jgi:DNA-binding GntR family transcriptional regulator